MLEIKTGKANAFNSETEEFVTVYKGPTFVLEHSLFSLSKWEAKYQKAFLSGKDDKSQEELNSVYKYIDKCKKVGVIKKNTAARKKSRVAKALAKQAK